MPTAASINTNLYGGDVRPSHMEMYKVLVRKTFLINRRRYRLHSSLLLPLMHGGINMGLWILFDSILDADYEYKDMVMLFLFRLLTPMCLIMSMKVIIQALVIELVVEKESKMMIVQLITGVPDWLYWIAYLSYFVVVASCCSVVWTILLCLSSFGGVNPLLIFSMLLWAYLHCFCTAAICATLLHTLEAAHLSTGLILMLSMLPLFSSQLPLDDLPEYVAYITGVLPNCSLVYWANAVLMLKIEGYDWSWNDNFTRRPSLGFLTGDSYGLQSMPPAGNLYLAFIFQLGIWAAFSFWLNQIWQAEHGTAKHPCFCLGLKRKDRAYATVVNRDDMRGLATEDTKGPTGVIMGQQSGTIRDTNTEKSKFWPARLDEEEDLRHALRISRLTKSFWRGGKQCLCLRKGGELHHAVNDLSLDVELGELFALLGHNGAGKTTAINCVSGMLPATSGSVHIMGINLARDPVACRWQLSVCPQDNPMYDELSVDEHLRFFSSLRGASPGNVESEVVDVLKALGLTEKRTSRCNKLSGGQKRRLWVATSLIGKSSLVFLDEPSSGMDPSSRRELWTLLLSMKSRGRSILFTTHYLEEADMLASRKAVLAKGRVKAVGTSKELKKQFGTGYHLKVLMPDIAENRTTLSDIVKTNIAGSKELPIAEVERAQASDAPSEVVFTLPYDQFPFFGALFVIIEQRREELQIQEYELAMTSLDEVFMALGKKKNEDEVGERSEGTPLRKKTPSGLEFQTLTQEDDIRDYQAMSHTDYLKTLLKLRSKQMTTGKVGFMGIVVPLIMIPYSTATSTGFFTHGHMMQGTYALFPGFIVSLAGMRLLHLVVQERSLKIAHAIIAQGMPEKVYWNGSALHSAIQMCCAALLSILPLLMMSQDNVIGEGRILFMLIGAVLMPITASAYYLLWSFAFETLETAMKAVGFINLIVAMFANMVPNQMWTMASSNKNEVFDNVGQIAHNIYSFVNPFYPLPGVILGCWRAGGLLAQPGNAEVVDPFGADWATVESWDFGYYLGCWVIWAPLVGGIFQSVVLHLLVLWRQRPPGDNRKELSDVLEEQKRVTGAGPITGQDSDVLEEQERVENALPENEACLYRNLHHTYYDKQRTVYAVRGISLGIKCGECFGLLGPNGAGKTTTLGCLTGEIRPPTHGEVYVAGHSVTGAGISKAYEHLGYCPQIDPIFPSLTGRWQLMFHGRMKGVPESRLDSTVDDLLQRLGIDPQDRDKPAKTYSGGMKRKLSLAIAFIGRSDVLFLDEPSAGVDASAKRLLWQAVKMRAPHKTIIITTHSMEEAEATCDRLAIQVMGCLRCLGSPLRLKSKYGSGYQLEITFLKEMSAALQSAANLASAGERGTALKGFLRQNLSPDIELLENHGDTCLYQLPPFRKDGLSLAQVFNKLQAAKQEQGIEEYSLAQATLEQVFLRFAREQL